MQPAHPSAPDSKAICRQGDRWNVVGDVVICKIPGSATNNAYAVIETQSPPGGGPPMHIHGLEDELFFVIEGDYELTVGGKTQRLGPGDVSVAPRTVPHCYRNVSSSVGRLMVTLIPAGFENFFRELHHSAIAGVSELEIIAGLADRYKLQIIPESAP